jgi:hypothetical protein
MRYAITFSLLIMTQLIWLSSLSASSVNDTAGTGKFDSALSASSPQTTCSAVESEFEISEFLHQTGSSALRNDLQGGFRVVMSARPFFCIQIDARGCRPPPQHG